MGIYYSLYEWYNPLWLSDKKRYVAEHMIPQFKDVVTHAKPSIIFSDGEWELPSEEWRSPGAAGVAVQRIAGEGRSRDRRPLGQGHAPQARRLLHHRVHLRHAGGDSSLGGEPRHGLLVRLQPRGDGEGLSHRSRTAHDADRYREPRRQPAARHRTDGRRPHPGDDGRAADADRRAG